MKYSYTNAKRRNTLVRSQTLVLFLHTVTFLYSSQFHSHTNTVRIKMTLKTYTVTTNYIVKYIKQCNRFSSNKSASHASTYLGQTHIYVY
jgi:hypothetical protein